MERAPQRRLYFWLMGSCIALILLAWNVVRFWSVPAAVAMSIVAAVIPPVAAIVGNWGAMRDSEPGTLLDEQFRADPDR
ncbi:MAG: hypothetical protein ACJ72D_05275 [Marmoricola sp.]